MEEMRIIGNRNQARTFYQKFNMQREWFSPTSSCKDGNLIAGQKKAFKRWAIFSPKRDVLYREMNHF